MCKMVVAAIEDGNQQVIDDVKRIAKYSKDLPKSAKELCNQIFHVS